MKEFKIGEAYHTRYGVVKCVPREECPCECCAFFNLEDVCLKWKNKKECFEVYKCEASQRKDKKDVAFVWMPIDYFTRKNRPNYD